MACSHHHSPTCCCSRRCTTPPPPPLTDPFLLQSIVSQLLLQNPQIPHLYSPAPTSAATSPFDLHPCSSQNQTHKRPKQKQFEDQFHNQYSVLSSLLQRIDVLESSIQRFSSPSFSSSSSSSSATAFSLRHVAARTIQIHFRAHLVRRSRALRELKELASIKSALNVLKSSLSLQKRLDFVSLSRESMHLIRRLDAIKSGDQMVRDSKSSIRREIGRFLGLVDEVCAKRNQVQLKTVKHVKMVRNDDKCRVPCAGRRDDSSGARNRGKASEHSYLESDEKRLVDNLRERVERIQHMSKFLEDEEEDSADSDDDVRGSKIYTDRCRRGDLAGKHGIQSHSERRVWFPEDRNATRVYDIHEDGEVPMRRVSGIMEKREESGDDKQHEEDEEVESDSEENDVESAEDSQGKDEPQNGSLESNKKVNASHVCRDGRLILSAPAPVKMEP